MKKRLTVRLKIIPGFYIRTSISDKFANKIESIHKFEYAIPILSVGSPVISKWDVSINETKVFDAVVKYSVSRVILFNRFSIAPSHYGEVHESVMTL